MTQLAGTGPLIRLIWRRDRIVLLVWVILLAIFPVSFASSYAKLYPTEALRQQFANETNASQSELALLGSVYSASLGGLVAWRWVTAAAILIGTASLLTVIRHTRTEEQAGRRELLGGAAVGRQAPLTAALVVTFAADLLVAILMAVLLIAVGLPPAGSIALGLTTAAAGWFFAALAGVAAQLTQNPGPARGTVFGALGLFFLLRVLGEAGAQTGAFWLSWLSPLGWMRFVRSFAGERWWVFGLFLAATAVLTAIAYSLSARRDLDAGLLPARRGPAAAAPGLSTPLALAWRLQRGSLITWVTGFTLIGAVFGYVAKTAADQLIATPAARDYFNRLGGGHGPADGFFTLSLLILVELVGVYAVMSALKLRGEETALRAEPLLAEPVSRLRWAFSHLFFALLGPTAVLAAFGLASGSTYGLTFGDISRQLPRVLAASLAYAPALWVLAGVTLALFGLLPRWSALSWVVLGICILIDLGGEFHLLSQVVLNLSPFTHVPRVLVGQFSALPLLGLGFVAALLITAGLAGFRRRDIAWF